MTIICGWTLTRPLRAGLFLGAVPSLRSGQALRTADAPSANEPRRPMSLIHCSARNHVAHRAARLWHPWGIRTCRAASGSESKDADTKLRLGRQLITRGIRFNPAAEPSDKPRGLVRSHGSETLDAGAPQGLGVSAVRRASLQSSGHCPLNRICWSGVAAGSAVRNNAQLSPWIGPILTAASNMDSARPGEWFAMYARGS